MSYTLSMFLIQAKKLVDVSSTPEMHIFGNEQEVTDFKAATAGMIAAKVLLGEIAHEAAASLVSEKFHSDYVDILLARWLQDINFGDGWSMQAHNHQADLLAEMALRQVCLTDFMSFHRDVVSYSQRMEDLTWLTNEGHHAFVSEGQIIASAAKISDLDAPANEELYEVALECGATHFTWTHHIDWYEFDMPKAVSQSYVISVGQVDKKNNFIVLDQKEREDQ